VYYQIQYTKLQYFLKLDASTFANVQNSGMFVSPELALIFIQTEEMVKNVLFTC